MLTLTVMSLIGLLCFIVYKMVDEESATLVALTSLIILGFSAFGAVVFDLWDIAMQLLLSMIATLFIMFAIMNVSPNEVRKRLDKTLKDVDKLNSNENT